MSNIGFELIVLIRPRGWIRGEKRLYGELVTGDGGALIFYRNQRIDCIVRSTALLHTKHNLLDREAFHGYL